MTADRYAIVCRGDATEHPLRVLALVNRRPLDDELPDPVAAESSSGWQLPPKRPRPDLTVMTRELGLERVITAAAVTGSRREERHNVRLLEGELLELNCPTGTCAQHKAHPDRVTATTLDKLGDYAAAVADTREPVTHSRNEWSWVTIAEVRRALGR